MTHIQRYPFAPKATWWKRYTDTSTLGKRTIYVATDTIGYEIKNLREFTKVELVEGKVKNATGATYVSLTNSALKLLDKIFIFDTEANKLEEHDIVDEGLTIINAIPSETMTIERNVYIRKYAFDCTQETDQQDQTYQPISGLLAGSSYLTIKTHNFTKAQDEPKCEDIIQYHGKYWMIEETSKTYIYTPREQSVLHISLKVLK